MSDTNQVNWEAAARTRELDLKEREVVAREREVAAKEKESKKSRWSNPVFLGVLAALLALVGGVLAALLALVGTFLSNWNARELEHQHSQSEIVLEAMRTGSPEKACTNLLAFVNLKLLDDQGETIRKNCELSPATAPYLPANGISSNPLPGLTVPGGSLFTNPALPGAMSALANPYSVDFNFQGLVVDASTMAPIPQADVSVVQVGNILGKTKTGAIGQFGFTLRLSVANTLATIRAEKEGYEPGESSSMLTSWLTPTIMLRKK